jgi:hypothetical protein
MDRQAVRQRARTRIARREMGFSGTTAQRLVLRVAAISHDESLPTLSSARSTLPFNVRRHDATHERQKPLRLQFWIAVGSSVGLTYVISYGPTP